MGVRADCKMKLCHNPQHFSVSLYNDTCNLPILYKYFPQNLPVLDRSI